LLFVVLSYIKWYRIVSIELKKATEVAFKSDGRSWKTANLVTLIN